MYYTERKVFDTYDYVVKIIRRSIFIVITAIILIIIIIFLFYMPKKYIVSTKNNYNL